MIAGQAGKAARDAERVAAGSRPLHPSHLPAATAEPAQPLVGEHLPARTPSTEEVLAEHARMRGRRTEVIDAGRAALRRAAHVATPEEIEQRRREAAELAEKFRK